MQERFDPTSFARLVAGRLPACLHWTQAAALRYAAPPWSGRRGARVHGSDHHAVCWLPTVWRHFGPWHAFRLTWQEAVSAAIGLEGDVDTFWVPLSAALWWRGLGWKRSRTISCGVCWRCRGCESIATCAACTSNRSSRKSYRIEALPDASSGSRTVAGSGKTSSTEEEFLVDCIAYQSRLVSLGKRCPFAWVVPPADGTCYCD